MVIIQRRYGILLFPWTIYWLLICAMPVACAIPIVYIERSELGAKDPRPLTCCASSTPGASQPAQLPDPIVFLYVVLASPQMVDKSNI